METTVEMGVVDQVATVTLIPPDHRKPPTMDYEVFDRLEVVCEEITLLHAKDPESCCAAVVRSGSEKFFSAGANIEVLKMLDETTMDRWIARGHQICDRIEAIPIPVIAVVFGYVLGGGLEFALSCDFILAGDQARFGQPEATLGFVSGRAGAFRLSERIGVARAKELFFTGKILTANEAFDIGIVNFVGSREAVESRLADTTDRIRNNSRTAVTEVKAILNRCNGGSLEEMAELERLASRKCITDSDTHRRMDLFFKHKHQP